MFRGSAVRVLVGWALMALVPVLAGSKCKNKPPVGAIEGQEQVIKTGPSVDSTLQLVSVRPGSVAPDSAAEISLFGAGFEEGAKVLLGDEVLGDTTWGSENSLTWSLPPTTPGTYDVTVRNPKGEESTLFGALAVGANAAAGCWEVRIYFDLNKAGLTDDAKKLLDDKMGCYQGAKGNLVVEGHADERGTTDYNLALGQRRAEAVRRHLVRGGLTRTRTRTVTFGEERPLDPGHTEEAWAKNRRAEIRLRE